MIASLEGQVPPHLPLALRYPILGTVRQMTAFADQSSARIYL